jgi:lipopolysaccharide/colanic/teichoic acid biosynthesis glycosyltransferase
MDHSQFGNGEVQIFYPDPSQLSLRKKISRISKRSIDILGSLLGLLIFSPVFLIASIAIKITSAGPVFFRQERVGKGGKSFKIYKFRTMTVKSDESEHREYMKQFIHGQAEAVKDETNGHKVFKLANDARVTPIGKFLRKSSLDEVPQFINVLLGDMSLVGPRPPIPYEVKEYSLWHRRRVLESKPGITGYWQIEGRSMTSFDGMVRMDINYINNRSTLFDLKVIIKTPLALLTSKGAC